jgi:hypothetical protein
MRTVRLNKLGLIFGAIYVVLATPLMLLWYFTKDVKASVVYGSLAVYPAGVMLVPFQQTVMEWPLLNTFSGLFLLNIALFYCIGWVLNLD